MTRYRSLIRLRMDRADLSNDELADRWKLPRDSMDAILKSRRFLNEAEARRIEEVEDLDEGWLDRPVHNDNLFADEHKLLQAYRALQPGERDIVLARVVAQAGARLEIETPPADAERHVPEKKRSIV